MRHYARPEKGSNLCKMRGLVEDTKKTRLSTANNNNISSSSTSGGSSRLKSGSTGTGASASGSKPLRSAAKTPTMKSTTSSLVGPGAAAAKKEPQTLQQQVGKSAKSSSSAATTTSTTTTRAVAAKSQKGQNPPPQQVQPQNAKQQQQPSQSLQQPQQLQQQTLQQQQQHQTNNSNTIALPKASHANTSEELAGGVQDTIYLCNFRVSVDGEWLCLKELQDIDVAGGTGGQQAAHTTDVAGNSGIGAGNFSTGSSNSSKRNSKRFSGLSTGSNGGGALDITDNGIMAIENLIGRRLCDMVHSGTSALASQSQHQSVGLFAEWSHLCRSLLVASVALARFYFVVSLHFSLSDYLTI